MFWPPLCTSAQGKKKKEKKNKKKDVAKSILESYDLRSLFIPSSMPREIEREKERRRRRGDGEKEKRREWEADR